MTSKEFIKHLKSYSPYDCYTFSFTRKEMETIKLALDRMEIEHEKVDKKTNNSI